MAYTPTTWTDNITQANAARFNKLEQGVKEAHDLAQSGTSGTVKSVNGVEPDASGNVVISGLDAGIQVGGSAPDDGWWIDTGSGGGSVPATIPGKVTALSATNNNGVISLSWAAPANGGSPITDYIVQHRPTSGGAWVTYADGTSTLTSASLTGLPNGVPRDFQVAAVNLVGTGAYSDVAQATPASDPNLYVSDNFDRPDSDTLGTAVTGQTWTWPSSNSSGGRIRSQGVETTSGNGIALIQSGQQDVYVEVTFVAPMTLSTRQPGVIARANLTGDYYAVRCQSGTELRIRHAAAGSESNLKNVSIPGGITDTDTLGLKVYESGSDTVLEVYLNSSLVDTYTDSTGGRPSGTYVGFYAAGNYGRFDDFTATNPSA